MRLQAIVFKTKIVEAALLFRAEKNFMRCVLSLRMPMESKGYGAIGQKVSHYKPLIAFRSRHTASARFRSMAKEEAMASRFSMGGGGSRGPGLK